jgi:hypothetical protein
MKATAIILRNLRKGIVFKMCVMLTIGARSQEIKVPMQAANWEHDSLAEFVTHRGVPAIQGRNGSYYQVFLKDRVFSNGTIEFDVELTGAGFPGINFRMSPDRKNGDNFYIRSFGPVPPEARNTLQYAAIMDGMSIWDLSDEYQSGAVINQGAWNHVKLVINGKQMKAYVNDMSRPALSVPELEGLNESGGISLSGNVIYANLVIRPNANEGLPASPGYQTSANDTRYIRNWELSPQQEFPFGRDIVMPLPSMHGTLNKSELPDSSTKWVPIRAESRAIVNLSRKYGSADNDRRRMAWLRTTITSAKAQNKSLQFGFSDEAWVFLNGQIVFVGKNYFGMPQMKNDGRCTIDNSSFNLPLKEGKNELLIGLANYFYGWGIIARFENMNDIKMQ